jgi:hypothetical protein
VVQVGDSRKPPRTGPLKVAREPGDEEW